MWELCLKNYSPLDVTLLLDTLPAYLAGEIKPSPQDPSLVHIFTEYFTEEEVLTGPKPPPSL